MRLCGICKTPPRGDDSLSLISVNSDDTGPAHEFMVATIGTFQGTTSALACRQCAARAKGLPSPADPVYPAGGQIPKDLEICGLCRRALRAGGDVRPIRLAEADLNDSLWEAYWLEMNPARNALLAAAGPTLAEYERVAAPFKERRDKHLAQLQADADRGRDDLILQAASEEEARTLLVDWEKQHAQELSLVMAEFEAHTAVAKLTMETAMARAEFPYRKAAIEAYRKVGPLFRDCALAATATVGLYAACDECHEVYVPRVAERLKREGLVRAGQVNETVGGDMLM
jgi:hypothetical protein